MRCLLFCLPLLFTISACAQTKSPDAQVRETLSRFVTAFDNLDWEQFRTFFDDDASVFFPRGFPDRADGRQQIETNFQQVFAQIRGGRTQPPYMQLDPKDLKVQMFGDIAIATFNLYDRPGMINRRTVVLKKESSGWKIIHLHASEIAQAH